MCVCVCVCACALLISLSVYIPIIYYITVYFKLYAYFQIFYLYREFFSSHLCGIFVSLSHKFSIVDWIVSNERAYSSSLTPDQLVSMSRPILIIDFENKIWFFFHATSKHSNSHAQWWQIIQLCIYTVVWLVLIQNENLFISCVCVCFFF